MLCVCDAAAAISHARRSPGVLAVGRCNLPMPYIPGRAALPRAGRVCTHANPAILGGIVGEPKWAILQLPAVLGGSDGIPCRPPAAPACGDTFRRHQSASRGWAWLIIPPAGRSVRGCGDREARRARAYFQEQPMAGGVAQQLHPALRSRRVLLPPAGRDARRILSITDKRSLVVRGDGRSTARTLVWRHPRYRAQAEVLLEQLPLLWSTVPAEGEATWRSATSATTAAGTMFPDGLHHHAGR